MKTKTSILSVTKAFFILLVSSCSLVSCTQEKSTSINENSENRIKLKEVKHAKKWTRKIIYQVLKYGGNFYLPVRCNASYDQLIQAYPQIQDLFSRNLLWKFIFKLER